MTGHCRNESPNNKINSTVLKVSQGRQETVERSSSEDEVSEAISKLQQNGVNCVFFTKSELLDLTLRKGMTLPDLKFHEVKTDEGIGCCYLNYNKDLKASRQYVASKSCPEDDRTKIHEVTDKNKLQNYKKIIVKSVRSQKNGVQNNGRYKSIKAFMGNTYKRAKHSTLNKEFQNCTEFPSSIQHWKETEKLSTQNNPIPLIAETKSSTLQNSVPESSINEHLGNLDVEDTVKEVLNSILEQICKFSIANDSKESQIDYCPRNAIFNLDEFQELQLSSVVTGTDQSVCDNAPAQFQLGCEAKHQVDFPDPSFYSFINENVRINLEEHLDGTQKIQTKNILVKRRKTQKTGYLLNHGDNYPNNPELSYKLNLTTQISLKLNRKGYCKSKVDKRRTLPLYLSLVPKRPVRNLKSSKHDDTKKLNDETEDCQAESKALFSGEWTKSNKYICGICRHEETDFWNMVTHKGEEHPGLLVTHVELPMEQKVPRTLVRDFQKPTISSDEVKSPSDSSCCSKCGISFSSTPELHRHIFECAGNLKWLENKEVTPVSPKKSMKSRRRRRHGMKRRFSNNGTPKKIANSTGADGNLNDGSRSVGSEGVNTESNASKSTNSTYQCKFCTRQFKTEGWLRNHMQIHMLVVSIPFEKLPKGKSTLPLKSSQGKCASTSSSANWSLRKYVTRAVAASNAANITPKRVSARRLF